MFNSPFTADELTHFWESEDQMGFGERTRNAIAQCKIVQPSDLLKFKDLDEVFRYLRKPPKTVQQVPVNPGKPSAGTRDALSETEPYQYSPLSRSRLEVALEGVHYYQMIGRPITPGNMDWQVLELFQIEWEAIEELKKDKSDGTAPKLTKGMAVPKYLHALEVYLEGIMGIRKIPLSYVIRQNPTPQVPAPPLLEGHPYSQEHGSVMGEMVARASHQHPLFRHDDGKVFEIVDTGTRGSHVNAAVQPWRKARKGASAVKSIRDQFAGTATWEGMVKDAEAALLKVWSGLNNVTLQAHCQRHRAAHLAMSEAKAYIPVDLVNPRQQVTYLLDSIQTKDANVLSVVAAIKQDETNRRVNFEAAVASLVVECPVAKKNRAKARGSLANAQVSGVDASPGDKKTGSKPSDLGKGYGKTGVPLRYHKNNEFKKLSDEQKAELREWRAANKAKGNDGSAKRGPAKGQKKQTKKLKGIVASAIKESEERVLESLCSAVDADASDSSDESENEAAVSKKSAKKDAAISAKRKATLATLAAAKLKSIQKKKSGSS